jgi:uncharacterized protein YeaO (DUF488 family)
LELYTSRWANGELAHLACQPVGISRGNPRFGTGYRYKKLIELAPSREAFAIEDWDAFAAVYRAGLEKLGLNAIVGKLERISAEAGGLPLVLLCFEASPDDCHRGLLLDWLRERGVEVRELQPGDLPEREGALEPRLF